MLSSEIYYNRGRAPGASYSYISKIRNKYKEFIMFLYHAGDLMYLSSVCVEEMALTVEQ